MLQGGQLHIGAPGLNQFGGAVFSRPLTDPITAAYNRTISHLNEMSVEKTVYHGKVGKWTM